MSQGKSSLNLRDEDEDSDDDEVLELKDRLAAYNLGSSPEHSDGKFSLLNSLDFSCTGKFFLGNIENLGFPWKSFG